MSCPQLTSSTLPGNLKSLVLKYPWIIFFKLVVLWYPRGLRCKKEGNKGPYFHLYHHCAFEEVRVDFSLVSENALKDALRQVALFIYDSKQPWAIILLNVKKWKYASHLCRFVKYILDSKPMPLLNFVFVGLFAHLSAEHLKTVWKGLDLIWWSEQLWAKRQEIRFW